MEKNDDTDHSNHLIALDAIGRALERCGDDGAHPCEIVGLGIAVRLLAQDLTPEPDVQAGK